MCACYPYGPTIVGSTLAVDLTSVGRALALTNVGRPYFYVVDHILRIGLVLCHQVQMLLLSNGGCSRLCGSSDDSLYFYKER